MLAGTLPAVAAGPETPIIEFRTSLYELNGESNSFHFTLGTKSTAYYDIDCGFGTQEYEIEPAVFDSSTQSIKGTVVTASVNRDGYVRIYGDPANIDYIDMDGCYITDISMPQLTNIEILNLENNQLRALDLTDMHKLQALYLGNNPFTAETPLVVGPDKPDLTILSMSIVDHLDRSFSLRDYPSLVSFIAWNNKGLTTCDPTGCPELMQLSIDVTPVASLDVTKNPKLLILNISETRIPDIDLSCNPYLTELYAAHSGRVNNDVKLTRIDLGSKPELVRLFVADNLLTSLDVSGCPKLVNLSCAGNLLTSIDISNCPDLYDVDLSRNMMDFVTLPEERPSFGEYYYSQNPFAVDRSYPVGAAIDFSSKVNRPGSTTTATLYTISESNLLDPVPVDPSLYSYSDGRLILLGETTDSVYVQFTNSALPVYPMTSSKFMVKSPENFGKPVTTATFTLSSSASSFSMGIGIAGASEEHPVSFTVDFGDGVPETFTATTPGIPATDNVAGTRKGKGVVTISLPEGTDLTAVSLRNVPLLRTDLSAARSLSLLEIDGCGLSRIDLTWNRSLTRLSLPRNTLTAIDLSTENGGYGKNLLSSINLADNRLTEVTFNDHRTLLDIDLSGNRLTTVPMKNMTNLLTLDVSDNLLEELSLQDCEALTSLDVSGNLLTTFYIPDYTPLGRLDLSRNNITIPNLPAAGAVAEYLYAPQKSIQLPTKAPAVNISSEWLDDNGQTTVYTWYTLAGDTPLTDAQISGDKGRFTFLDTTMGNVWCSISHPSFPDFKGENAITTSAVEAAGMPSNLFASFTTLEADTAEITLTAARPGTAVYIDWKGNGDLEQYPLATTFSSFPVITTADANVKCYSYDEDEGLTVFSFGGVKTKEMDASRMKNLINFTCSGTGMTADDIKLPQSPALSELNLNGNALTSLDWIDYPSLRLLNVSNNSIPTLDLTRFSKLEVAHATDNATGEVILDNPLLWDFNLNNNSLASISLAGAPAIEQLWLSNNSLTGIDLSPAKGLRVLFLDGNKFTFTTLPAISPAYTLYNYLSQQPIDVTVTEGRVDLSSQAMIGETTTSYHWFIDSPYLDESGALAGEELVAGEEYTLENGVTTFHGNFTHIMCVMINDLFPGLYLMTSFINVTSSSLDNIGIDDSDTPVEYYNLQGIRVTDPAPGIYIRRQGSQVSKVYVR